MFLNVEMEKLKNPFDKEEVKEVLDLILQKMNFQNLE